MKTYKKATIIENPMLEIVYDTDAESPRTWSNLGYFISCDTKHISPDNREDLIKIVKDTGEYATSQENHIALIKSTIEGTTDEKVLAIYPVTKHEHSNVSYKLGTAHGFDNSNNSFYIVTEKTAKEIGIEAKDFEKIIASELEVYTTWANGDMLGFRLYDDKGELQDACYGFYDIADIGEALGDEWAGENLSAYIKHQ